MRLVLKILLKSKESVCCVRYTLFTHTHTPTHHTKVTQKNTCKLLRETSHRDVEGIRKMAGDGKRLVAEQMADDDPGKQKRALFSKVE